MTSDTQELTVIVMDRGGQVLGTLPVSLSCLWMRAFRCATSPPPSAIFASAGDYRVNLAVVDFTVNEWVEPPRITTNDERQWVYTPGSCELRVITDAPVSKLRHVRGFVPATA